MTMTPHWCKVCSRYFAVDLADDEQGDFELVCGCGHPHYRRFAGGVAVSCEPSLITGEVQQVKARGMISEDTANRMLQGRQRTL